MVQHPTTLPMLSVIVMLTQLTCTVILYSPNLEFCFNDILYLLIKHISVEF